MALIRIEGLLIEAVIGVYDWERDLPQQLGVSLEMTVDVKKAVRGDRVSDTVDYDKLSKHIIEWAEDQRFHLVESMAVGILKLVMAEPGVQKATVVVSKPGALKDAEYVDVQVSSEEDL